MKLSEKIMTVKSRFPAESLLRILLLCVVLGVFLTVPAFAVNEYAENGARWILDGLYWVALCVIVWQLFKNVAAKNISGAVIMAVLGALCIILIVNPEVLKALGEKLLGIVGLSS